MANTFAGEEAVVKSLLEPEISREFERYRMYGYPIKLKCKTRMRWGRVAACMLWLLGLGLLQFWVFYLFVIPIYIYRIVAITDVEAILYVAKKIPNFTIEQIVAREIKR